MKPPMAKNHMARAMREIMDRPPSRSDKDELWAYFRNRCAYCGCALDRATHEGHLDHARAFAGGGTNSIFNRILSCGICNGDEKREMPWEEFLKRKVKNRSTFETRRAHIQNWLARGSETMTMNEVETIIREAFAAFDQSVAKLRTLRKRMT